MPRLAAVLGQAALAFKRGGWGLTARPRALARMTIIARWAIRNGCCRLRTNQGASAGLITAKGLHDVD